MVRALPPREAWCGHEIVVHRHPDIGPTSLRAPSQKLSRRHWRPACDDGRCEHFAPHMLTALIERPDRLVYLSSGMHRSGDASLANIEWWRVALNQLAMKLEYEPGLRVLN